MFLNVTFSTILPISAGRNKLKKSDSTVYELCGFRYSLSLFLAFTLYINCTSSTTEECKQCATLPNTVCRIDECGRIIGLYYKLDYMWPPASRGFHFIGSIVFEILGFFG